MSGITTDEPDVRVPNAVDETLAKARQELVEQLEEHRESHEAFLRLEQILNNFDAVASGKIARRGGGPRAPRGSRSAEFVQIVREAGEEGTTVAEAGEKMPGINLNYLYRLAKDLTEQDDAPIRKDGKQYFAV